MGMSRCHTRVHSRACSYDVARRRNRRPTHSIASAANSPMMATTWTKSAGRYRFMMILGSWRHDGATGDVKNHAGDPGARVGGEKERGARDVFRQPKAPNRMHLDELRLLKQGYARLIAVGQDGFRCDTVHANAEGTRLGRDVLREHLDPGFSGGVRDRRVRVWSASRRW